MRRLFPFLVCAFLFTAKAPAQNEHSFRFHDGRSQRFIVESDIDQLPAAKEGKRKWLRLRSEGHPDQAFESGDRIAVQINPGSDVKSLLAGTTLKVIQEVSETMFVLQAADANIAAQEAERLAKHGSVLNCSPVMRSLNLALQTPLSSPPNDPLYSSLWHLDNPTHPGVDLNIRGAWPLNTGASGYIIIADQAVDILHPEYTQRTDGFLNYNFINDSQDLMLTDKDTHATAVAGLALASLNNSLGIAGVAPQAYYGSWRIFSTNGAITDDQHLMNMFQHEFHSAAIQNHSWASTTRSLYPVGFLTRSGIDNATANGRGGRGVVMVRSAGNRRLGGFEGGAYVNLFGNANDDGFCTDPNVIVVGAARSDGRVTRYSSPGANVLVAGLSNESLVDDTTTIDPAYPSLLTTATGGGYTNFTGTSGAVPQISGVASLMLANPNLGYRDVQQILLLSSRHFDLADPDVRTNGAGLRVSHNLGFGIPDARTAVYFSREWQNRPARVQVNLASSDIKSIPDPGFVVQAEGTGVPVNFSSIPAQVPRQSQHPDIGPGEIRPAIPESSIPVVYVGQATNDIAEDLSGKCALIQRGGGVNFTLKVQRAEAAGASMALVYNTPGDDSLQSMNLTHFPRIPSAFIGYTAGNALAEQSLTNSNLRVQLQPQFATYSFHVTNQLSLEHVGMKIRTDNLRRSDIRITLTSPQGTESILQRVNNDPSTNAPIDWTYVSNQHFYESSVGTWTLRLSDEVVGATGVVHNVELQLFGVPITDNDADGLDDALEITHFGNLAQTPSADPDGDGFSHLHEFLLGSDPNVHSAPVITQQPVHRATAVGESTSFNVQASRIGACAYQWKFNGTDIAGATKSQLDLTSVQASQQGNYSVEVSNLAGTVLSSNAQLAVLGALPPESIESQSFTLVDGTNHFLLVTAPDASGFRLFTLDSTNAVQVGNLTYLRTVEGTAKLTLESLGELTLTFSSHTTGTFSIGSSMGTFTMLEVGPDFNGDGHVDFLFQNTNRVLFTWTMEGAAFKQAFLLRDGKPFANIWRTAGTTDFNNDGMPDILLQDTSNRLAIWLMHGTQVSNSVLVRNGVPIGAGWRSSGTGDFNNDGKKDILFQRDTGALAVWLMDSTGFVRAASLRNGQAAGNGWKVFAAGDMNGDRQLDVLFHNAINGKLAVWYFDNLTYTGADALRNGQPIGFQWRAAGVADLNHDGKLDVIFQNNNTGSLAAWLMDGKQFLGAISVANGKVVGQRGKMVGPK